jgi:hypothetical protein
MPANITDPQRRVKTGFTQRTLQPRVVKRRPLGYSRMTRPRGELKRELLANGWGVT